MNAPRMNAPRLFAPLAQAPASRFSPAAAGSREQHLLERAAHLPSPPGVVMALLGALEDERSDADSMATLLGRDPALTARVLKVANSSYYAMAGRVGTVSEAMLILGLGTIRKLVIALGVANRLAGPVAKHPGLDGFWRHGTLVAAGTAALARRTGCEEGSAFIGGLLHDIGKLALASAFPAEFSAGPAAGPAAGPTAARALAEEAALFGRDHASLGGWLAGHWRFPEALGAALRDHHEEQPAGGLAQLIWHADRLAHAMDDLQAHSPGPVEDGAPGTVLQVAAEALVAIGSHDCAPDLIAEIERQSGATLLLLQPA